ncbi:MAG: hypothetical protein FJ279_06180 [Planctomycetes bacterium]|nr:hypothetical protein [Planctomycetota bacterium]MBM4081737.1 hypothetical protein [Planctomycetota bacterium]MBM4087699.1 hypothetical protein [Planctomycetota bacterium]
MQTTKLKGKITADRRLMVEIPREIRPGAVDVILLSPGRDKPARRRARRRQAHPAFGIWAKRTDITDSAAFAARLRRRLETRTDGNHRD